jgi:large subunit ribosomal protein L31
MAPARTPDAAAHLPRSDTVKADLHPVYKTLSVVCACGNKFETRSTSNNIHVEVCSQCHPYFTGKQRMLDTAGRVDRFRRKYGATDAAKA